MKKLRDREKAEGQKGGWESIGGWGSKRRLKEGQEEAGGRGGGYHSVQARKTGVVAFRWRGEIGFELASFTHLIHILWAPIHSIHFLWVPIIQDLFVGRLSSSCWDVVVQYKIHALLEFAS